MTVVAAVDSPAQPRSTLSFDLVASFLGLLIIAGVYLDGWAHNHDKVDESFFTPGTPSFTPASALPASSSR